MYLVTICSLYRVSKKKLMPFQIQMSREFHYGTLSIPIDILTLYNRTDCTCIECVFFKFKRFLFCFVLFCFVLFCFVLFCLVGYSFPVKVVFIEVEILF